MDRHLEVCGKLSYDELRRAIARRLIELDEEFDALPDNSTDDMDYDCGHNVGQETALRWVLALLSLGTKNDNQ